MEANVNNPATQYRQLDVQTSVHNASPHELVEMLFQGLRDRLNQAQGHITQGNVEGRTLALNSCVEILIGLQASLDHEQGGDVAGNLDALYDYMQRRLFRANADDDAAAISEVADLLQTLRSAWTEIGASIPAQAG